MSSLELSPQEIQTLGEQTAAFITRYLSSLGEQPIVPPDMDPHRLRALFDEPLPWQPQGVDQAFADFTEKIARNSVRVGHPRFLAWVRTSPLAAAVYAEALAAALNQSVAVYEGAPAATEVELRVLEWLKELSGCAPTARGILTSGGSMANFAGLMCARTALDPASRTEGLSGKPPMTVYITAETHYCIPKAAEMLGLGRKYVREVAMDANLRMDPVDLARQLDADIRAGLRPMAVAATLGTTSTGACDNLPALAQVCRERRVWLHVDGAYGGVVNLDPENQHLAAGLAEADSFVLDPHKGLMMPFEAGCVLVKDPNHLLAAFATHARYLPDSLLDDPDAPFHFRDYGPQLSRTFRALKIYLSLKIYGAGAIAAEVQRQYRLAQTFAQMVQAQPDFELAAPQSLGVVAFRYLPPGESSPQAIDRVNYNLFFKMQARGRVYLAGTSIHDRTALRVCFITHRTLESDLPLILDEVRACA